MDIALPAGYTARPASQTDAEAVTALVAACERQDIGEVLIELEDIVSDWQQPSLDLARDSVLVFAGAEPAACGEVSKGRRAEVHVAPEHRGRGLGTALLRWTWVVAREAGGSVVGQTIPESLTDAQELFARHGYEPMWTSWVLEHAAHAPLRSSPLPAGTRIRQFVPGQDERAAYQVIEDAFNEWPNREPTSFADWEAGVLRRPGFEPWHLQLIEVSGEVVAVCLAMPAGDSGWVDQIAVRRDHRGRGLARALLMHAFVRLREHGVRRCQLSTDSRTGALGLYEHVGMQVTSSFVHWAKQLDGDQRPERE